MAANQTESSWVPVRKSLVAEKCKQFEIYGKMWGLYKQVSFCKKRKVAYK